MRIRIVAFGVIGLLGVGAVAALATNLAPALPAMVSYPVAETSSKSDRLPLKAEPEATGAAVANEPAQAHGVAAVPIGASPTTTANPKAPVQFAVTPRQANSGRSR